MFVACFFRRRGRRCIRDRFVEGQSFQKLATPWLRKYDVCTEDPGLSGGGPPATKNGGNVDRAQVHQLAKTVLLYQRKQRTGIDGSAKAH